MSVTGVWLLLHAIEVWRLANVGRVGLPLVDVAGGKAQALPARVAIADRRVLLAEPFAADAFFNRRCDLLLRWPDVLEVNRRSLLIFAKRLGVEVVPDAPGERVSHNKRRAHQVVRADIHIHAALEVAIAAEHAHGDQSVLIDGSSRHRQAAGRSCRCRWCIRSPRR